MAKKQTVAKNALPATVVPRRDRAKGNREERGGHHATIWTNLLTKHTEEIKVMQAPFKCASMLGHRLRVDKHKDSYTQYSIGSTVNLYSTPSTPPKSLKLPFQTLPCNRTP